jgi:hypothetical protein
MEVSVAKYDPFTEYMHQTLMSSNNIKKQLGFVIIYLNQSSERNMNYWVRFHFI